MTKYRTNAHCKFSLKYHVILVCKYRKKLLSHQSIANDVKNISYSISKQNNFSIDTMEVDKDHIHYLIDSEPKVSPKEIVRKLKSATTVSLWKQYEPFLKKQFWVERTFWSDGYFVCSTGDASTETIQRYIDEQG